VIALTEERKQQIINEQPGGLWLVLAEEYPRDVATADDLLGSDPAMPPTRPPALSSAVPGGASSATGRRRS
jgi:hypothetical protein